MYPVIHLGLIFHGQLSTFRPWPHSSRSFCQMTAVGPVLYLRSSLPRVLRDGVARKERK